MLWLWRSPRPLLPAVTRGFALAPARVVGNARQERKELSEYYAIIKKKYPTQALVPYSVEAVERTTRFLMDRGISEVEAVRTISRFVALPGVSAETLERKIAWFRSRGVSQENINRAILRHPWVLGNSIEKYDAWANWLMEQGVSEDKLPFMLLVGTQTISLSIEDNLDPMIAFFREVGLAKEQIARILTVMPQICCFTPERLRANMDFIENLGIPHERMLQLITNVPNALALKPSTIQTAVHALDEMFGVGSGVPALVANPRIVMYNIKGVRESFDYLVWTVGFTPERLAKCCSLITRNVGRFIQPRFEFLQAKGVNTVARTVWIVESDRAFINRYPEYEAYLVEFKAQRSKA